MESSPDHNPLPDHQPVLKACAVAAVLGLLVVYCYHEAAMRRDVESTTLFVGSQTVAHDAAAAAFAASFASADENALRVERLAKTPSVAQLAPIRHGAVPERWLSRHVSLRRLADNQIEVTASGERNTDDLVRLVNTTVDFIRHDAASSHIPVSVVSQMQSTGQR